MTLILTTTSTNSPTTDAPNDADADTLLIALPKLYALVHKGTGVLAVLFGHVQRCKLYEHAGFKSMKDYAFRTLGVESEAAFHKLTRASTTAWKFYPDDCEDLVQRIIERDPMADLPKFPCVTVLTKMPAALRPLVEPARTTLINSIRSGTVTAEQLAPRDRSKRRPRPTPKAGAVGSPCAAVEEASETIVLGSFEEALLGLKTTETSLRNLAALPTPAQRNQIDTILNDLMELTDNWTRTSATAAE